MKILFLTNPQEDYLADSVFHGFRTLYGADCVDYPKCEIMYKNCPEVIKKQVRGNGFTLYSGLLDDIEVDRFNMVEKIKSGFFDLVIFGNIQRQFGVFTQYRPWLTSQNTVVLDGDDTTQPYPARGFWWRRPYYWTLPRAHKKFLYFKREWTPDTHFSIFMRLVPASWRKRLCSLSMLRTISFSFPEEKIITTPVVKEKDFPTHIVDTEVAAKVAGSFTSYAFDSEREYYHDLQKTRFGITVKRAGWDCLRHYEIAANGAVMCFKDLVKKPENSAPHGLSGSNTISYSSYEDLMKKISTIDDLQYEQLQLETLRWIRKYTTTEIAKRIISEVNNLKR